MSTEPAKGRIAAAARKALDDINPGEMQARERPEGRKGTARESDTVSARFEAGSVSPSLRSARAKPQSTIPMGSTGFGLRPLALVGAALADALKACPAVRPQGTGEEKAKSARWLRGVRIHTLPRTHLSAEVTPAGNRGAILTVSHKALL
ncbi:hypothetical protein MEX01_02310 [Methylorubrum extorquens]|nr:hypothetical protein MEX01_02310 [Methylorubrum extorquens]